jgi:hypothetical protein
MAIVRRVGNLAVELDQLAVLEMSRLCLSVLPRCVTRILAAAQAKADREK